jgi:hypothetical protein
MTNYNGSAKSSEKKGDVPQYVFHLSFHPSHTPSNTSLAPAPTTPFIFD